MRNNQENRDTKKTISFRTLIQPSEKKFLHHRIESDGTIEKIMIKFYKGQQLSLKVIPFLELKGLKALQPLVMFAENTDQFLAGDDEYITLSIDYPCKNDDYLQISVENVDAVNAYNLALDVEIDYLGGINRVV